MLFCSRCIAFRDGPAPYAISGVALFNWQQDILPLLSTQEHNQQYNTVPFRHYRTYPTMQMPTNNPNRWSGSSIATTVSAGTMSHPRYAEVNQTVIGVDDKGGYFIYGVTNDTFGCYKWNLESCQISATYTLPHARNSIQVNNLYTMALNHNSKELLIGGEDGQLRIWDTRSDQYVDAVNDNVIVGVHCNGGKGSSITATLVV